MDYNFLRFTNKTIQYDKTMLSIVLIFLVLVFVYFLNCICKRTRTNRNFEENKRKKAHVRKSSEESINEIFNISKNKINLVTKLNTILNKFTPKKLDKIIYDAYNKILGKDTNSYFQTIKNKFSKKTNVIKIKKNVKFDDSNLIRDIYI